ncbi:alpha/beta hydrolase family protein [Yoonia maritima]|uniref:Alpha/beta hydrolase family protein n=1 Tax=Yoonia maritima TaxID=1435347 RepID=A0A2T0VXH3_9RHOB|nr:alpha/beta hydrolase [Yoonia maritima]PRY76659.1 alpha/beta hydrolase family protein [Yoonia maritima]
MLFELVYPGLCLAEGLGRLAGRRRLAGTPYTYRATRCRMKRREIDLLTKVSPQLGARVALRRFEAMRPREQDGKQITTLKRAAGVDATLVEKRFGPKDGPRILLVHGWNATGDMMHPLAAALAAQGAHVIVPDLPGEGANPAAVLSFTEKARIIAVCYADLSFDAIVGHSAGGLIAAQAIEQGLKCQRLLTVCSPLSMATLLSAYLIKTAAPLPVFEAILAYYERRERRNPHQVGAALFKSIAGRITIVHAQNDWQVKVSEGHAIAGLCATQPFILDKCNHHTILDDLRLHDFVARTVMPAKAGALC